MFLNLNYYYGNEADQYSFFRIPKVLFKEPCFKSLTTDAKLLYGLMLDRMGLSIRNRKMDEQGRVYILFTLETVMDMLDVGHNKATRLFRELEQIGLIERRKRGLGKPATIYVKNFILPKTPEPPCGPGHPHEPDTHPAGGEKADAMPHEGGTVSKGADSLAGSVDGQARDARLDKDTGEEK